MTWVADSFRILRRAQSLSAIEVSVALSRDRQADLMLLGVTWLAAVSWVFSKEAVALMAPLAFMAVRFLIAGFCLTLLGRRELAVLSGREWRRGMTVGLVFAAGMSCWIMGLTHGKHLGEGAFLTILGVLLVPVMARLLFAERAPRATWVAIPVAVAGLALLALRHGFRPEVGQIWYVVAAHLFALFYALNTRAANHGPLRDDTGEVSRLAIAPGALTAINMLTVGVITSLLSWLLESDRIKTDSLLDAELIGWVLASALIGSAARFLLQTKAQSLSPHSHGVVILVVEPVWVALLAALWFGETMTGVQLAGCGLIFTALLISRGAALRDWLERIWSRQGA